MSKSREVMSKDEVDAFYAEAPWPGATFHNPYTFIPFPEEGALAKRRRRPTPLTIDEVEQDRFTGILELEVTTVTPLMTCNPTPVDDGAEHNTYEALKIGSDVIVPATGVRGSLRSLLAILVGGTLSYLDEELFLCQGRDVPLGPRGKSGEATTPKNVFLGRVKGRPSRERGIELELGETRLVESRRLERLCNSQDVRPTSRSKPSVYLDNPANPSRIEKSQSKLTPWQVKFSGRKVNSGAVQHEGAFKPDGRILPVDFQLYRDYLGRHRNAVKTELNEGDLVWLEPKDPDAERIDNVGEIKSIQWARWGRAGVRMLDAIPEEVWPDYLQDDGKVDEITDLFGMASPEKSARVAAFAARVRPENLVFFDAASKLQSTVLAPLAPPKPGCIAFYRDTEGTVEIPKDEWIRGYKVYRVPAAGDEPWHYREQPVFDEYGEPKPDRTNVNKTAELLPPDAKGTLRIAVRGLSRLELAMLLQACEVPWRLGGGKPLGLGACSVRLVRLIDEEGEQHSIPSDWRAQVFELMRDGVKYWTASQKPVARMRYPRAVQRNRNRLNRGGHVWFQRHASPKKGSNDSGPIDLENKQLVNSLHKKDLPAQRLPEFDPTAPDADFLQGYDLLAEVTRIGRQENVIRSFEPFDPSVHATGNERSGGNHSQTRDTRQGERMNMRGGEPAAFAATVAEPAATPPPPTLTQGIYVDAEICEDTSGKGRAWARHVASGRDGVVQNGPAMPSELQELGTTVRLYVKICTPSQLQFEWRVEELPSAKRGGKGGKPGKGGKKNR